MEPEIFTTRPLSEVSQSRLLRVSEFLSGLQGLISDGNSERAREPWGLGVSLCWEPPLSPRMSLTEVAIVIPAPNTLGCSDSLHLTCRAYVF